MKSQTMPHFSSDSSEENTTGQEPSRLRLPPINRKLSNAAKKSRRQPQFASMMSEEGQMAMTLVWEDANNSKKIAATTVGGAEVKSGIHDNSHHLHHSSKHHGSSHVRTHGGHAGRQRRNHGKGNTQPGAPLHTVKKERIAKQEHIYKTATDKGFSSKRGAGPGNRSEPTTTDSAEKFCPPLKVHELYDKNEVERLEGDITHTEIQKKATVEPHVRAIGGGKLDNAMEIVEIVNADEPKESLGADTCAAHDRAEAHQEKLIKTSVSKCLVWMEANRDHEPEKVPMTPLLTD